VGSLLLKLPNLIVDIQNRQELANPLLKSIESCIKVKNIQLFKEPANLLISDIKVMNDMIKAKEEYEVIKAQLKRYPNMVEASKPLLRMSEMILAFNECQIELESSLEHIFQMCLLIKSKGKKIIREDSKEDIRDLLSYVNLLIKPDFYNLLYEIYNKDDLVYAIMHLQSQKSLLFELKKQEPYKSGLSTITTVKEEDLKNLVYKWQELFSEIDKFRKAPEFLEVFHSFCSNITIPFDDLRKLSEKLREYHKAALHYLSTTARFKRFRYKLFKFCLEEFNERVELLWPG
jgi:hypothetical protein